jgi:uncharacterized protein YbaR (Trm112 family)
MDPGGCLCTIDEIDQNFEAWAQEIRREQDQTLEEASRQLLASFNAAEEPNIDVSKPLVKPLFALPCGFVFPECAICYEQIEMVNVTVTTCGHSFHASCSFKALDRTNCCPLCRHQLVEDEEEEKEDEEDEQEEQDEEDEDDDYVYPVHDNLDVKVTLEQLTGKLINMGYTMTDLLKSMYPDVKSETNEEKYTEGFIKKLNYDILDVIDGTIAITQ